MRYVRNKVVLIIALFLCLSLLCGCGNTGSNTDLTSEAESTAQISQNETSETDLSETSDDTEDAVTEDSNMNVIDDQILISVNGHTLTATLAQNSSAKH